MINQNPKRSNEPPVWLMFSAGSMISALTFPVLILILGFLLPFGIVSAETISTFAHHWLGKAIILVLTVFPIWSGLHRIHHSMHDLKIHVPAGHIIFYGLAIIFSIVALFAVIAI